MKKVILKYRFLTNVILYFHKTFVLKKRNITIGKNCLYTLSSIFEGHNSLHNDTHLINCYLGNGTYISNNSNLKNTKIGKFSSIGPYVTTIFGNHPTKKFVSTHPAFFSTRKQAGFSFTTKELFKDFAEPLSEDNRYSISIGNDVWIGAKVTILDGVKIGDGAIIAAGAIVNKNVPPYSIVGGVPAKIIKKRFEENEIDFLLKFKWWEKSENWMKQNYLLFCDINDLIKKNKE